jgi:predicted metal-binding protein
VTPPGIARLSICVTCKSAAGNAGQRLFEALAARRDAATPVRLHPVSCLANCARGCSAAIGMAGKWRYLLGGLAPDHAGDLLTYAALYVASARGVVLPSRRPPSLAESVLGRFPPEDFSP